MIPIRDNQVRRAVPAVTWTLIALNCLIYLWDRQWHIFGLSSVFADLAMRPREVVLVLSGETSDPFPLVTLYTSMFLHGNLMHLLANMLFLLVFGFGVEEALGSARFSIYYLAWGLVAAATHIYVDPGSTAPTLGASGAIGGVLGCYFLLFPGNRIEIIVPIFPFVSTVVSAWILLGVWFLWQILIPQAGVAQWAHAGGFLAGMLTILVAGGRGALLRGRERELDYDFD